MSTEQRQALTLKALVDAEHVLSHYASSNPKQFYNGEWIDPNCVHATLENVRAALASTTEATTAPQAAQAVPVAEIIDANAGCNCLYERRIPKWLDGTPPVGTKLYANPPQSVQAVPTEDDIDTELAEHEVALTSEQREGVHAAFRALLAASQQGGRT